MSAPEPLGLLGGTFDPVHVAHLRLAEEAHEALGLARVRWIPAGLPAHRDAPSAAAAHRVEMVRRAIAGNAAFELDVAEASESAPSYTVPTLERLRRALGDTRPLVLLMGADAFRGLSTWHRWEALPALAHLGVATRPGSALDAHTLAPALARLLAERTGAPADLARWPAGVIVPFAFTALDVSASALRVRLAAGGSGRYLIPDSVLDYIGSHNLYRT